ncbi:MAG: hypothetical protein K6C36_05090 [Clostridia bacterium]|nr:hypothetical protein [Clostridia bacterium]
MKKKAALILALMFVFVSVFATSCGKKDKGGDDVSESDSEAVPVTQPQFDISEVESVEIVTDESGETETQLVKTTVTVPVTTDAPETTEPAGTTAGDGTTAAAEDKTTAAPQTTAVSPTTAIDATTKAPAGTTAGGESEERNITSEVRDVAIIRSGTFYIAGTTLAGDELTNMAIASVDGKVCYLAADMPLDDVTVSIALLKKNDTTYLIYPPSKIYVELTAQAMSMFGLEGDEFDSFTDIDLTSIGQSGMTHIGNSSATIGSTAVTLRKYQNPDGTEVWYYTDGDTLLRMENYSSSGVLDTTINFENISATLPAIATDVPDGYTQKSVAAFITELGPLLGIDF